MTIDLNHVTLEKGAHDDAEAGMCLMEAVSYVNGDVWSDHPTCASPILGTFGRALNDVLPDAKRQLLVPLIPSIVGTADDGHDQARGLLSADWLIRVYTPAWLRLAGLVDDAERLEQLPVCGTWDDVEAALPVLRVARDRSAAAWDAARAAAWDAAGAAAWDAAGAAAWAAAGAAAWAAAGAAAGAAAWAAAWDAARDAARDALQPTVDRLQDSAIELFGRMVNVRDDG